MHFHVLVYTDQARAYGVNHFEDSFVFGKMVNLFTRSDFNLIFLGFTGTSV